MDSYKLLLLGNSGTGKSSLLLRFTDDRFLGENVQTATIGVDFKVKFMEFEGGERVKLNIWDTAGQERFRTLTSSYYRGAEGVILVYDVSNRQSFVDLQAIWLRELKTYADDLSHLSLMIVGNKIDKEKEVEREEGAEFAEELGALFMECSAKTKQGVQAAFEEIVHRMHKQKTVEKASDKAEGGRVGLLEGQSHIPTGCC